MKTKLIRIGNSRGIRIPKLLIEQAGLEEEIELRVIDSGILIEAAREPRTGWAEAAQQLQDGVEGGVLNEPTPTVFDEVEWSWE